jgi:hypothetical protein
MEIEFLPSIRTDSHGFPLNAHGDGPPPKIQRPPDRESGDQEVTRYLTSWREILIALGMRNDREDREKVRNLNTHYAGPIAIPKRGAQPKVDQEKLIAWWNGLEAQWTAGYQRGRDAKATAEVQLPYGREGIMAPEIGGVKKRRKDCRG